MYYIIFVYRSTANAREMNTTSSSAIRFGAHLHTVEHTLNLYAHTVLFSYATGSTLRKSTPKSKASKCTSAYTHTYMCILCTLCNCICGKCTEQSHAALRTPRNTAHTYALRTTCGTHCTHVFPQSEHFAANPDKSMAVSFYSRTNYDHIFMFSNSGELSFE